MSAAPLTPEQLTAHAAALHTSLQAGLTKGRALLELSQVHARLFYATEPSNEGVPALHLASAVNAFIGIAANAWLPQVRRLYEELLVEEYLHGTNAVLEVPGDVTVQALAPAQDAFESSPLSGPAIARAIVLRTRTMNFLVVLNEVGGQHSLHIRRFWSTLSEVKSACFLDDIPRSGLTLEDALRISSELVERCADDLPGMTYPSRLSLPTILKGALIARSDHASAALRYGDGRDKGYVLSFRGEDLYPEAENMLSDTFQLSLDVAEHLAQALDELDEACED